MPPCRRSQTLPMLSNFCSSPFFLGLLLGFCFHIYSTEFGQGRQEDFVDSSSDVVSDTKQAFIPILNTFKEKDKDESEKVFVRPRFVKDELNISKRLLMVVLADQGGNNIQQENLFNWTLQPYINDVIFIGNQTKLDSKTSSGSADILDVLKHVSSHYLNQFQLFYIVPGSVAVHGENIKKYTDALSASDFIYAGKKSSMAGTCRLETGVILSQRLIRKVLEHMDWCNRNKVSYDQSQNLQNCILHSASVTCQDPFDDHPYIAQQYKKSATAFDKALLFHGADSPDALNTLLYELNAHNENEFYSKIERLESDIKTFINSSKYEIAKNWPTASNPQYKSTDRFDRDVSISFNQTHQLNDNEYDPATKHDYHNTKDTNNILNQCNVQPNEFSEGWRKVDATRGIDYIFKLSQGTNDKRQADRKCVAVKELANPEIVPMPFVTESFRISLIIPIMEKDSQKTMNMLRSFAKNSIENSERIFLMLVFIYTPERPDKNNNNDFFKDVKQLALQISKKYKKKEKGKNNSHLLWYSLQTKGIAPSNMELMDLVTHKLDDKTIILLGSPDMEIRTDYFNRVRMNTILNKQVFCPIPFVEYHPAVVYGKKRPTTTLNFNTSLGHFDTLNNHHISFYKGDYLQARASLDFSVLKSEAELCDKQEAYNRLPEEKNRLCALFQKNKIHTLTAPDPSLRLRYEEIFCDKETMSSVELSRCLVRRTRSFGKRSQLAEMVLSKE